MHTIKAKNIADGYHAMVTALMTDGVKRGETRELTNVMIKIEEPFQNTYVPNRDLKLKWGLPVSYMLAELLWSGSGDNSLDYIAQFSKFWNHLSEDGKTVNSAYGYIAMKKFGFSQIDAIIDELKKNPNSRRATLKINVPRTPGTPSISDTLDEWCTMYLQFQISDDNRLDMTGAMRSNDVWFGFPIDYTYFLYIQYTIAKALGIKTGSYTHIANSLHVYDNHYDDLVRHMKDWKPNSTEYNNYTLDYGVLSSNHVEGMGRTHQTTLEVLYEEFKPEASIKAFNVAHNTEYTERTPEIDQFTRKRLMERAKELDILVPSQIGEAKETISPVMYYKA